MPTTTIDLTTQPASFFVTIAPRAHGHRAGLELVDGDRSLTVLLTVAQLEVLALGVRDFLRDYDF